VATCAACGADNRESAPFCDVCGAPLAVPAAPREQRKTVTVVVCDVTGSTALGEALGLFECKENVIQSEQTRELLRKTAPA
jgi:zinc ribbon protein